MTIKHLAYRFAHEFKGGAIALANMMGKGEKVFQNKLNPNSETHFLNIDEFEMLADFADRNLDVAEFFAHKVNAVVVQLPAGQECDMALLDVFMSVMKELGEVSSKFQQAYADGVISQFEYHEICKEVDDVIARLLTFKNEVNRVSSHG